MKSRQNYLLFALCPSPKFGAWYLGFPWSLMLGIWIFSSAHSFASEPSSPRQRLSFNSDWRFIKGDPSNSLANLDYQALKPWLLTIGTDLTTNAQSTSRRQGNPGSDVT